MIATIGVKINLEESIDRKSADTHGSQGGKNGRRSHRDLIRTVYIIFIASLLSLTIAMAAMPLFTQNFPGNAPTAKILSQNCTTLNPITFPASTPSSGTILFNCSGAPDWAFKVNAAGNAVPKLSMVSTAGGPPIPYTSLSVNVNTDPPVLPCIPSTRTITNGTAVTFTSSDVGGFFDYCAAYTASAGATFPSFTITWSQ
jgi:hypothetical protein